MRNNTTKTALVALAGILLAGATTMARADDLRSYGFFLQNSKKRIMGEGRIVIDDSFMIGGQWTTSKVERPDLDPDPNDYRHVYEECRTLTGGRNVAAKVEGAPTTWFGYRGLNGQMVRKVNLWFSHATEFSLKADGTPNYQIRQYIDVQPLNIIWDQNRGNLVYLNPDDYAPGTYHLTTQVRYWKGREWSEWYILFIRLLGTASNVAGTDVESMQVAIKDAPASLDSTNPANDYLVADWIARDMGYSVTGDENAVAGGVINLANRPAATPPPTNPRLPEGLPQQPGMYQLTPGQADQLQGFIGKMGQPGTTVSGDSCLTIRKARASDGRDIYLITTTQAATVTVFYDKGFKPQVQKLAKGQPWEVLRSDKYPVIRIAVRTTSGIDQLYTPDGGRVRQ